MGLFDKILKKEQLPDISENEICAVCNGELIPTAQIPDPLFAEEIMGKTLAIEPKDGAIAAPAAGVIEEMFPTGHAFGLRMSDGTGLLIHIGVDTVSMNGKGFTVHKKKGDHVQAGEKVVTVDLDTVAEAGHPGTVMIVITEPAEGREYDFIPCGVVSRGDKLTK